jgi:mannose-6-phosphate isomerase
MREFCILQNPIQEYAWGSRTAIAELLGAPSPSAKPQAELWMGAHPKAPSEILIDGRLQALPSVLKRSPAEILGAAAARDFGNALPFLFKVLAAEKPLSIQAHPDIAQAREGFARENDLGIPLDSPNRNYKDANHKPETICALTPFWALNGFRAPGEIISLLGAIGSTALSGHVRAFERDPNPKGLERFFESIMTMDRERQRLAVEEAVGYARGHAAGNPAFEWMLKLDAEYPADIGVLSPVLLNLVRLAPGEAMFLHAGRLHAYLQGVGMELMANSDNVLRGGLTPKHVDVPELLRVLVFDEQPLSVLEPAERAPCERVYETHAREFELSVIDVSPGSSYASPEDRSVEIVFCTSGRAIAANPKSKATVDLSKGTSVLIPAALPRYTIEGRAVLYKAAVPRG